MFTSILAKLVIGLHYFCVIFLCQDLHSNKMKPPNGRCYAHWGTAGEKKDRKRETTQA